MNREQKIALSLVFTTLLSLVLSIIAVAIAYVKVGMPKALMGFVFLGLSGVGVFSVLFFKRDEGKVTFDERDKLIRKNATIAGFAMSYLFVGLVCMIPYGVLGPQALISVRWLPRIFCGAGITMFFVGAVATLIEYGWGGKEN